MLLNMYTFDILLKKTGPVHLYTVKTSWDDFLGDIFNLNGDIFRIQDITLIGRLSFMVNDNYILGVILIDKKIVQWCSIDICFFGKVQ